MISSRLRGNHLQFRVEHHLLVLQEMPDCRRLVAQQTTQPATLKGQL